MRFGTDLYRNMYLRVKAGQCLQSKKEGEIIGLFEKRQKKDKIPGNFIRKDNVAVGGDL